MPEPHACWRCRQPITPGQLHEYTPDLGEYCHAPAAQCVWLLLAEVERLRAASIASIPSIPSIDHP